MSPQNPDLQEVRENKAHEESEASGIAVCLCPKELQVGERQTLLVWFPRRVLEKWGMDDHPIFTTLIRKLESIQGIVPEIVSAKETMLLCVNVQCMRSREHLKSLVRAIIHAVKTCLQIRPTVQEATAMQMRQLLLG